MQSEYSLLYRERAEERSTTRALGLSFVAYSPLGRGLLTGAVRGQPQFANDPQARASAVPGRELQAQSQARLASGRDRGAQGLHAQAARARVAALWGRGYRRHSGTKRIERLENLGAIEVTLSREEMQELSEAIPLQAPLPERAIPPET